VISGRGDADDTVPNASVAARLLLECGRQRDTGGANRYSIDGALLLGLLTRSPVGGSYPPHA
jgi:hypothetical protein